MGHRQAGSEAGVRVRAQHTTRVTLSDRRTRIVRCLLRGLASVMGAIMQRVRGCVRMRGWGWVAVWGGGDQLRKHLLIVAHLIDF